MCSRVIPYLKSILSAFKRCVRKEKLSDDIIGDVSVEELKSVGLSLGDARRFKKEVDATAAAASPALKKCAFPNCLFGPLVSKEYCKNHDASPSLASLPAAEDKTVTQDSVASQSKAASQAKVGSLPAAGSKTDAKSTVAAASPALKKCAFPNCLFGPLVSKEYCKNHDASPSLASLPAAEDKTVTQDSVASQSKAASQAKVGSLPAAVSLLSVASRLPSVPLSSLLPLDQPCGHPGASGSVFKIEYQGKPAAAKRFHEHMRGMLSRELKSLQLLAHPNIVRVMAVVTDAAAQPIGFIMEYCPVSLDEAMSRMSLRQAVHALVEACIGVAVAHDAQIIHSDIKPGNILCSDDFSVIKLADFGLAHAITASMSAVSGVRGTALYMAPELHEDAPLSVATDVFSFGMTTWQLLHAGVMNPLGTNIVTISSKLARGQRPDFTRVDAPPALKDLVARCLAHDPTHRPIIHVGRAQGAERPSCSSCQTPAHPPHLPPSSLSPCCSRLRTRCLQAPSSWLTRPRRRISLHSCGHACVARLQLSASAASAALLWEAFEMQLTLTSSCERRAAAAATPCCAQQILPTPPSLLV
jgi:hypothetical protein